MSIKRSTFLMSIGAFLGLAQRGAAATKVTVAQLGGKVAGLMMGVTDGAGNISITSVKVGAGLQIVTPAGGSPPQAELQATTATVKTTTLVANVGLTPNTEGILSIIDSKGAIIPASIQLYRNGVRQSPGSDYMTTPTTGGVTIAPVLVNGQPWDLFTDAILADYQRA